MLIRRYDDLLPFPTEEQAAALIGVYGIACVLAGFLLDTFLFGVFVAQFITYCTSNYKDKLWVRCIVAGVTIMACLLTGYNWWFASHTFVYHFGVHTVFFETGPLSWLPFIDSVTMSFTQAFFAHRAYRLCNRNIFIPIAVGAFILMALASTITTRVVFTRLNSELDSAKVLVTTVTWMAATMAGDTIITISILYGLIHAKTGLKHTNKLITRLVRMTLESQLPATIVALCLMIEVVVDPPNMLGVTIIAFQSKIYVVGFFYSLNARTELAKPENVTMNDTHGIGFSHTQAATIVVDQQTETHVMQVNPRTVGLNRQPLSSRGTVEVEDDSKSVSSMPAYSSTSVLKSSACPV